MNQFLFMDGGSAIAVVNGRLRFIHIVLLEESL